MGTADYSLMESSDKKIPYEHLINLSRLHNVTTDFLLTGNSNLPDRYPANDFIPYIPVKAHAGFLKNLHEEDVMDSYEHYRIPGYNPTQDSLLVEIEGDSMEPSIMSGEVLICQVQPKPDRVPEDTAVVLLTRDQVIITRLREKPDPEHFCVESDNPEHAGPKRINRSDVRRLLVVRGKVSNQLMPPPKSASNEKMKSLEDSLESLKKEVYQLSKKIEELNYK